MLGEGKAGELLAEILHHVVALELAMDQHVEPDLFLPAHGPRGFCFCRKVVVGDVADRALGVRRTRLADLRLSAGSEPIVVVGNDGRLKLQLLRLGSRG